jgi:hypothetical protein
MIDQKEVFGEIVNPEILLGFFRWFVDGIIENVVKGVFWVIGIGVRFGCDKIKVILFGEEAVVFDGDWLLVQLDYFPFVTGVAPTGSAFVVGFDGQKSKKSIFFGVLSLIDTNNDFLIILLCVKLFHLHKSTVPDILIDNLVVFAADIVNNKVFTGVVQDLLIIEGNERCGQLVVRQVTTRNCLLDSQNGLGAEHG